MQKKITTKKQTNKKPQTNKQTNSNKNNVPVTINLGGKLMDGRTVECTTLIRDDYLQDDRNIGNFFFLEGGRYSCQILHIYPPITEEMIAIFPLYSPHNMHMKLETYRNYSNYPYN